MHKSESEENKATCEISRFAGFSPYDARQVKNEDSSRTSRFYEIRYALPL